MVAVLCNSANVVDGKRTIVIVAKRSLPERLSGDDS